MERKKIVLVGAGIGLTALSASQRARRAARLRPAVEGIADVIEPTREPAVPREEAAREDESHAPGHRHLPPPPPQAAARERRGRRRHGRDRHGARLSDRG